MRATAKRNPRGTDGRASERPYYFVSYSTGEPQIDIFIECLEYVFRPQFDPKVTPSSLQSGASQQQKIEDLIRECAFGVVLLDGLRPNVVFEWGLLRGNKRPVMLFKEKQATVDIRHLIGNSVDIAVPNTPIDVNSQFSNVKDINYCEWNRYRIKETLASIWDQYTKKESEIKPFVRISKPDFSD